MKKSRESILSKRERQIMDVIYKKEKASVNDVINDMADPPGYSAVRTLLNILVTKGFLKTKKDGNKYIYIPVISKNDAAKNAINKLVKTFFNNSVEETFAALINIKSGDLSDKEYKNLMNIIKKTKDGN